MQMISCANSVFITLFFGILECVRLHCYCILRPFAETVFKLFVSFSTCVKCVFGLKQNCMYPSQRKQVHCIQLHSNKTLQDGEEADILGFCSMIKSVEFWPFPFQSWVYILLIISHYCEFKCCRYEFIHCTTVFFFHRIVRNKSLLWDNRSLFSPWWKQASIKVRLYLNELCSSCICCM